MLIHFYIKYSSQFGESLHISFSDGSKTDALENISLTYLDEQYWHVNIQSAALPNKDKIIYSVFLNSPGQETPTELIKERVVDLKKVKQEVVQIIDGPVENNLYDRVFHSLAFKQIFGNQRLKFKKHSDKKPTVIFKVTVPALQEGYVVCISGSGKRLKNWNTTKPLQLSKAGDEWSIRLDMSKEKSVEYKFGVFDTVNKTMVFEEGENRTLLNDTGTNTLRIFHFTPMIHGVGWKGAGLNIPVSSIRTAQTWGIGNFTSLNHVVDLARKSGLKLIQLLPVNDTLSSFTNKDSYPYSPISVFALHPLYMNVQRLATAFGVELSLETMEKIHALNELPEINYKEVTSLVMRTLKDLYDIEKQSFKNDYAWFEFFDLNRFWLVPYAAFCFLRDKYGSTNYDIWEQYSVFKEDEIQELVSPDNDHYDSIALYYFIQYHLHLQLKDARDYAHKYGIILKGDLPIGVGRYSVDTWMYPNLFNLNYKAGAPPDAFSDSGQNWGFPIYNWEAMAENSYSWWQQRMQHLENYFDAIRIDHVIGFFRIWSIPGAGITASQGKFIPAQPLSAYDFQKEGIDFNEERFCSPFISDKVLEDLFGIESDEIKHTFLQNGKIKDEFDTQTKIHEYLKNAPEHDQHRDELLQLVSNVILIKEDTDRYHFRMNMINTSAFKNLSIDQQHKLSALYHYYFFEKQNALWYDEGIKKLSALDQTTDMLLFAEDLGMVPVMLEEVLEKLQMLALRVQRMPVNIHEKFSHPKNAPYLSVVTPSTHDMSTLRGWWLDDGEHIQYFYNYLLSHPGEAPTVCDPLLSREIILQHLKSPAMWSIFLVQDLLGTQHTTSTNNPLQERINDPADADHNWNYRMHLAAEDIARNKTFTSLIKKMIRESGR